jgi:hypothetical protein
MVVSYDSLYLCTLDFHMTLSVRHPYLLLHISNLRLRGASVPPRAVLPNVTEEAGCCPRLGTTWGGGEDSKTPK